MNRLILAIASALALSACGVAEDTRVNMVFADNVGLDDPVMAQHLSLATQTGLVAFDAKGQVSPAIAQRWVVSDDGLSYIFRIDDLEWGDGEAVTASQVVAMLNDARRRAKDSAIGPEMASIRAIIARSEEVIEIELNVPRPRLLDLLASPSMALFRRTGGKEQALGNMTSAKLGNGRLLTPINRIVESEDVLRPPVFVRSLPLAQSVIAYRDSHVDVLTGLRFDAVPLVQAANIPQGEQRLDTTLGHFGLAVRRESGLLASLAAREAIAMALDRPRMVASFGVDGWREMNSLSPRQLTARGDVPDYDWLSLNAQDRKRRAAGILAPVLRSDREVSVFIGARGPGADQLFGYMRADLADVGVTLTRVKAAEGADLVLIDEVADFDDPLWYLTRLSCARMPLCSADGDALVRGARAATTIAQRRLLLSEAEAEIMGRYGYIPLATPLRLSLVRPGVSGFEPNLRGLHLPQYLRAGS